MRYILLAVGAIFASIGAANAGVITISILDDGVSVPIPCVGGVNSTITCNGGSADYSNIFVGATGVPPLNGASLASLTLDATASSGGTHTLTIDVNQTGLAFAGPSNAVSTFTINHTIGGPFGPTTMSTDVNGGLLASTTFPVETNDTRSFTDSLPGLVTSTSHHYAITTTAAGQAITDTIQLLTSEVNVPEPGSIAVLGMGMIGLGLIRRKRNSGAAQA